MRRSARYTPRRGWRPSGVITMLSDFGNSDAYVGIMRGVMLSIAPGARLVDLTHEIPPQSVTGGALLLRSAIEYFPAGTVHLAVVDPGVGSERAPIVAITERGVLVGPDNGLLQPSWDALGLREVRIIASEEMFLKPVSRTFHGRDIFAPTAAYLASGRPPETVGPRLDEPRSLQLPAAGGGESGGAVSGIVVHVDHFGNLISDIAAARLDGEVSVEIAGRQLPGMASSYSDVAAGDLVVVEGSWGTVEVACNGGSAATILNCGAGTPLTARRRPVSS